MANVSISSLYASVTRYGNELKELGFDCTIEVFKSGSFSYPSYVEFQVEKESDWMMFKIFANGYGAAHLNEVSTANGWSKAKAEIESELGKIFN